MGYMRSWGCVKYLGSLGCVGSWGDGELGAHIRRLQLVWGMGGAWGIGWGCMG